MSAVVRQIQESESEGETSRLGAAPAVRVGDCGLKGRGVIANREFRIGDRIESAPVIVVPAAQCASLDRTILYDYLYAYGESEDMAVALGFGSLYNHSNRPNARYVRRIEDRCIDFVAIRPIHRGEEVTVNYNGAPDASGPLWFPVHED